MKALLPLSTVALCLPLLAGCNEGQTLRPYPTPVSGNAERGRQIIEGYGCGACHMIPGVRRANGLVGPPLIYFSRRTMIAGELPNTRTRSKSTPPCPISDSTKTRLTTSPRISTRCAETH
jgi:hypothetical protein